MLRPGNLLNLFFSHRRCVLTVSQKNGTVNILLKMPGIRFVKLYEYQKHFIVQLLQQGSALRSNLNFLA